MAPVSEQTIRTITGSRAGRTIAIVVVLGLIARRRRKRRGNTELRSGDVHVLPSEPS